MVKHISWLLHFPDSSLSQECYSNVELITDRNFSSFFAQVLNNNLIFHECAMDHELVVASIVALSFLIVSIHKAQGFRFLSLYLVFERRQCDLTNALLAPRIKRLQERRRRRGTLARPQGWFQEMYRNPDMFLLWKNDFRVSKETFDFWMNRFMLILQEIIVLLQKDEMKIT